ncbi:MAG: hypothetical protein NC307_07450 [Roseburia sp.]|nr:hypothetical protein [Roseburia sp.]
MRKKILNKDKHERKSTLIFNTKKGLRSNKSQTQPIEQSISDSTRIQTIDTAENERLDTVGDGVNE